MRDLPKPAQRVLWVNFVLGGMIASYAIVLNTLTPVHFDTELFMYVVLAVLAGSRKVNLMRQRYKTTADVGSMSLAYVLTLAATLRFGPQFSVFIGAFAALSARKRH